jgi:hypothetical protein
MELAKQPEQKLSTAVEKISQGNTVQALVAKRFDVVSESLPKRIDNVFEVPKVREMILATDEKSVAAFIEFELIKLAERINVSGNLTTEQIEFIALQLIREFPNESIADFKICFERGATGRYGKIFKLDSVEIGVWMSGIRDPDGRVKQFGYLDEKYQALETQMMKEKDDQYKRAPINTDWLKMWAEAVAKTDSEGGVKTTSQNITFLQHLRAITPNQIKEEGQEQPKKEKPYKPYLTEAELEARRMLTRAASDFYRNKKHGFDLKSFTAPFIANGEEFEVEFFAETESDAIEIYALATK